jgi:HAD superfamily hydrolase (TIGR01509 family)
MDGVLVDSTELHFLSWNKALEPFGIALTRSEFLAFFGRSPTDVTEGILGSKVSLQAQAEIRRRKDEYFDRSASQQVKLLPGAKEWVSYFSGRLPQAVATSATFEQASRILETVGLNSFFQAVVTSSDVPGKPDPGVFLKAARRLGVETRNCLVIEDSPSGVAAARRAGTKVIAVCSTNTAAALADADLILPDLTHLTCDHLDVLFSGA